MIDSARWERIKSLFQDVLERPREDRPAYLREACQGDRALQTEVESLLAVHDQVGSFAEYPANELLNALADSHLPASPDDVLRPGDRLGVFEIQRMLGAGGMGDVYQARDTRLDRMVAIKVLPSHLAANPERYRRFEREARAIASLDHPHIGALYDVGQDRDLRFLVMQYLDGETLAARLAKGQLPLEQLLRYAIEIAEALDHAHRRGVIHRDLKPGNIFLTKSGVKLIDFGLAAWRSVGAGGTNAEPRRRSSAPEGLTKAGVILGTLHYMAPEQLNGHEVDERTDLFAFGAVVYEMATGTRPFKGEASASVIAAILHSQPPSLLTVLPETPPPLAHLVDACLAKEPDARWQSAGDAAHELRWVANLDPSIGAKRVSTTMITTRTAAFVAAGGVLVGSLVGAALWSRAGPPTSAPVLHVTRSSVATPAAGPLIHQGFAVSPDGTHLAYVANGKLYLRALDEFEWKLVSATEGTTGAVFSPDSRWVAFFANGALKKVGIAGGAPQVICRASDPYGATWGADDIIVFTDMHNTGLSRVAASGGTPTSVTTLNPANREKSHRYPNFLPNGKAVLFNIISSDMTSFDDARIAVVSLDTGRQKILLDGGMNPRYSATGHLIYSRGASLFAAPFDVQRLEITGEATPVLEGVSASDLNGYAGFGFASDGLLAYVRGGLRGRDRRVMSVDRQGNAQVLVDARRDFLSVYISPNGQQLALTTTSATDRMWLYDLARRTLTPLTSAWDNRVSAWTPNGKRITFFSDRAGAYNLYWQTPDAGDAAERLTQSSYHQGDDGAWSPDGRFFVFHDQVDRGQSLSLLTFGSESSVRPLIATQFSALDPRFSPDGRWLAYDSDDSGREEVYVRSFPDLAARWQISTAGGIVPVWNPRGRELFYWDPANEAMTAVPIQTGSTFKAGTPRVLFKGHYLMWNYDVTPDGQRFIMIEPGPSEAPATEIALLQNWTEELKRRASIH
jgi:serine/threonine protein kinase/WD40 repeat protein